MKNSEGKVKADCFASDLITALNKEHGSRIAYNLATDTSPTHVKRWISTGSKLIDYIVSNRSHGGLPEGRIVEIFGPPSIGKSHLAIQVARSTQLMGGIVVYIDTENATSVENLEALGIDISSRFVFIETSCTEDVFKFAQSTILKAKALNKDVPITIIWDSVAASSPKAELLGDYDKDSIGLQARAISKGMRKITQVIGDTNTLFLILNQVRTKIGVMFGDPDTTPGGKAIPFHSSVRLKLGAGQPIKNKDGDVIGINVWAKTIKNKVAPPFRKVDFEIHFGVGIKEHEQLFDMLRKHGEIEQTGKLIEVSGTGAWKKFTVVDSTTGELIIEKKFYKADFDTILDDANNANYINLLIDDMMIKKFASEPDIDPESYEDVRSLSDSINEATQELGG
jgi:recombination protein RecA